MTPSSRCPSIHDGMQCGLEAGHDGSHTGLIPSNPLWKRVDPMSGEQDQRMRSREEGTSEETLRQFETLVRRGVHSMECVGRHTDAETLAALAPWLISRLVHAENQLQEARAALHGIADYGWAYDGRAHFSVNCASMADARRLDALLTAAMRPTPAASLPEPSQ
jgi:hypothetical protein